MMHVFRPVLFLAFLFLAPALRAQGALKTPDEFLPHHLGDQFTPHHLLTDYFEYLAAAAPATMKLERYGATNEDRPLQVAFFSSPENMARLEQIRLNNLRLAGLAPASDRDADASKPTAIVWLSMSVHGNEPSGSECSMLLAYQLASQTDPDVQNWLKNTVVIVDPSLNPDGYDRYTHWYRGASNRLKNPDPDTREHREPWPGGRTNHYYYDLNRDWAWATQVETRQRLAVYQRWLPHVHADLHEQYIDNPYYFAPAAEPMHAYITPWQRDFQTQIGENHARYFDNQGWLYFTREVFDLFYPSYGDTYPMFNGAIGMTYEQAGHSTAGRAVTTATGDTLRLIDRIRHHLTTSRSTIETASKNARSIVDNFRNYYDQSARQPQGPYQAFVVRASNDPNKIQQLCQLLDLHHIRYGRAGASATGLKGYDYLQGKQQSFDLDEKDLVISAFQPHSVLLQVLFEPEHRLSDSLTYDITAWALPYAYGLETFALQQRLEPKRPMEAYKAPEIRLAAPPYAWCVHRRSLAEARFLNRVLENGVKVRYAMKGFALADQVFDAGALVINRADNQALASELDALVQEAARETNVPLHPIFSGWTGGKGRDLGSENFVPVALPSVALVYGDDVDANSYGHTWFFFEQELEMPVSPVPIDRLERLRWSNYSTLVFPNGNYNLSDPTLKALQEWVRQGGRIIAFEGGVKAFADKDGFQLKSKADERKDSSNTKPLPYQARERDGISDQVSGAIVQTEVDGTNPLAFGLSGAYFSLKTTSNAFEMPANAACALWLGDDFRTIGFIGSRLKPRLKNSPVAAVQKMGQGDVVYLVDNPLFRSFWEQGKLLFANALFF